MNHIELKNGNEYIIKTTDMAYTPSVYKIVVTDLTETTIQFKNLDSGNTKRMELNRFGAEYKIIEHLGDLRFRNLLIASTTK